MSLWPKEWASKFAKVQKGVIVDCLRFPTVEHDPQFLLGLRSRPQSLRSPSTCSITRRRLAAAVDLRWVGEARYKPRQRIETDDGQADRGESFRT